MFHASVLADLFGPNGVAGLVCFLSSFVGCWQETCRKATVTSSQVMRLSTAPYGSSHITMPPALPVWISHMSEDETVEILLDSALFWSAACSAETEPGFSAKVERRLHISAIKLPGRWRRLMCHAAGRPVRCRRM